MKQKQRMQNRKQTNLLITTGTNNALKCSKGKAESPKHRVTKYMISAFCWERSLDFATEVVFKNNKRADIIIKDWCIAIEILNSEKIKDFQKKNYPIPTIPITSKIPIRELYDMLEDLETMDGSCADYYIKKLGVTNQTKMK